MRNRVQGFCWVSKTKTSKRAGFWNPNTTMCWIRILSALRLRPPVRSGGRGGHRVQRLRWKDFPEPQIGIWGELPPGHRVIPIRDLDSNGEVCTVQIGSDFSPLQMSIAAEQASPWLAGVPQSVASQSKLFLVDHARQDPFSQQTLGTSLWRHLDVEGPRKHPRTPRGSSYL